MRGLVFLISLYTALAAATLAEIAESIALFDQASLQKQATTPRDANLATDKGKTVLMYAAYTGNVPAIKWLLSRGADINASDDTGKTALMLAIWNGHTDAVKELLAHGANVHAKTTDGTTALLLGKLKNDDNLSMMLKQAGAKE